MNKKFEEAFSKHKQGKLTDAENLYKKILEEEPKNADVWNLLGLLYSQINDFSKAEEYIKKALELNPRLYYLENLARIYLDGEKYETASNLYADIVKHSPKY